MKKRNFYIMCGCLGFVFILACIWSYNLAKADDFFESPFNKKAEKVEPVAIQKYQESASLKSFPDLNNPDEMSRYMVNMVNLSIVIMVSSIIIVNLINVFIRTGGGVV